MILKYIGYAQIVISLLLIVSILLQSKGAGLSAVFGGEGNVYTVRRGAERLLFIGTIVLSVLLFGLALTYLFIK